MRVSSDDTAHGFHIAGTSVNVVIPKRGRGEVSRFVPRAGTGTLRVRVHAHVRRRPPFHAGRAAGARPVGQPEPQMTALKRIGIRLGVWAAAAIATTLTRRRTGAGREPRRPDSRDHADRIHGIPAGSRGFHGGRDRRGRPGAGVQRDELRRPVTTCRRSAAPASCSRPAPAIVDATGAFDAPGCIRQYADAPVLGAAAHLPAGNAGRRECRRAARADSAVRRRPRARRFADDTLLALEDPFDRDRQRRHRRAAIVTDVATGERRVGRLWLEGAAGDAAGVRGRRISQRNGDHQRPLPKEFAFGDDRRADEALRSAAGSRKTCAIRSRARRGIDNFEAFMRFLAPLPAAPVDAVVARRRTGLRSDRLRRVPRAGADDRTELESGVPPEERAALLGSPAARHRDRGRDPAGARRRPDEIRTPALWGLRHRRPFLHDGSAFTIEDAIQRHLREGELARRGFAQLSAGRSSATAGVPPIAGGGAELTEKRSVCLENRRLRSFSGQGVTPICSHQLSRADLRIEIQVLGVRPNRRPISRIVSSSFISAAPTASTSFFVSVFCSIRRIAWRSISLRRNSTIVSTSCATDF